MSTPEKSQEKESVWKKVGPCLYRYKGSAYYALIKRSGKQIRQSLETTDFAHAKRKLAQLIKDLETKNPEMSRMTLESYKDRFFATLGGAERTIYKHTSAIKAMLVGWPPQSPKVMDKIRKADCEAYLASLKNLANSSINEQITTLTRFFKVALNDGVITRNPMDGIAYRKRQRPIRNTPTEEQFRAIVKDLRSQASNGHGADNTADFVELAGTLGLGQAELSGIRRQDIDLKTGIIRVFRRKTSQQFTIPIFSDALPIIKRRLKSMPSKPEARLLPQDNCKKALAGACKRLNFQNFEPRSLRRFHITRCLRKGVDAPTVALWQGHRDGGALVLKTYQAEVGLDHSLKMAEKLKPAPVPPGEKQ